MKNFFSIKRFKKNVMEDDDMAADDYVELDNKGELGKNSKVIIRPFTMTDVADLKPILDSLREGYTIALINIKPLKEKDLVELKRAINKLKKTTDAIAGDIAGFSDDYIVIAPSFAQIYRSSDVTQVEEQ